MTPDDPAFARKVRRRNYLNRVAVNAARVATLPRRKRQKSRDDHPDENDPGFEDVVRAWEDAVSDL